MDGKFVAAGPVLVAGGAGFLGSHLCARLLRDGHRVLCVDDLSTGELGNIEALFENPRFEFRRHDIREPLAVEVSQIYNLACPAAPPHYRRIPLQTLTTSVQGSLQLLELARHYRARVLFTSTSEIYGDPEVHPQVESYWGHVNPLGPRACYNEGKRCAETLHQCYRVEYGLDIKVARLFNTYGPHMPPDDGRVVSNYIVAALRGEPLLVFGSGEQTRSFCYVDDLVEGLVRLMATPTEITGPVNLGNPEEYSVVQLARLIAELVGVDPILAFRPLPEDDPRRRRPCIDYARELLEWQPTVSLRTGLSATIAYFRHRLGLSVERSDRPVRVEG